MNGYHKKLSVLLTNDDGFEKSDGLKNLFIVLSGRYKMTIAAPVYEQSGASHSITILSPIFIDKLKFVDGSAVYAVKGTPTDCVKIACSQILNRLPDFVISGINLGANVGLDVFYSATAAAAIESSFWGVTSFAVSMERSGNSKAKPNLRLAAQIAEKIIRAIIKMAPPKGSIFNINIPADIDSIKGARFTRNDLHLIKDNFIKGVDPRGRPYYWMKAGIEAKLNRRARGNCFPNGALTDVEALKDGYISITPLKTNITDEQFLGSAHTKVGFDFRNFK